MLDDEGIKYCKNTHEEFMKHLKLSIYSRVWCYANHDINKLYELRRLMEWGISEIMERKWEEK